MCNFLKFPKLKKSEVLSYVVLWQFEKYDFLFTLFSRHCNIRDFLSKFCVGFNHIFDTFLEPFSIFFYERFSSFLTSYFVFTFYCYPIFITVDLKEHCISYLIKKGILLITFAFGSQKILNVFCNK